MSGFDAVALGDLNCDMVLTGLERPPMAGREVLAASYGLCLGGSTGIFAGVLGSLGARVGFIGLVGHDELGGLLKRRLAGHGVDTGGVRTDASVQTGLTISLVQGRDRALVTVLGTIAGLRPEHIPWDYLCAGRHLHVASYYLQSGLRPAMGEILVEARRHGLSISLDTGWDPRETWDWPAVAALLPLVDVFLPNETEALHLTGARDADAALTVLLAAGARTVAVKRGSEGAIAGRGNERVRAAPFPAEVIDPTGAGDSFDAGFIYRLLQGGDLSSCLAWGNASGSLAVGRIGGAAGAPGADEVEFSMHAAGRLRRCRWRR